MSLKESIQLKNFWFENQTEKMILAEIVHTSGSCYRKTGAKKIISKSARFCGQLSGGCLEHAITEQALQFFDLPLEKTFAAEWNKSFGIKTYDATEPEDRLLGYQKGCSGSIDVQFRLLPDFSQQACEAIFPELSVRSKLVVFGAGIDAIPLHDLLHFVGIPFIICDYRHDLAKVDLFPKADQVIYGPVEQITKHIHPGDSLIFMSHNYEADLQLLSLITNTNLNYIGFLGPSSRLAQLQKDLLQFYDLTFSQDHQRVSFAPVGLNIHCEDPTDIAVSIVAQIQNLKIFTSKQGSIHANKDQQPEI